MNNPMQNSLIFTLLLTGLGSAFPAMADHYAIPKQPVVTEECGSCHMVFPPQLLDANSWQAVMAGLPKHFGMDASLDEERRANITRYLTRYAGGYKVGNTIDATGKPLLRITQTQRFLRKHHEIAPATWKRNAIKSPANCTACHSGAANGDFEEHGIRIPK